MMILIKNGLLIHGDPTVAPDRADLLISGKVIERIAAPGELDGVEPGARVIDAAGMAVLPGLIDCHVHLIMAGDSNPHRTLEADGLPMQVLRAAGRAMQQLRAGVTTVRDLGGPEEVVFALRDAIEAGVIQGCRVLTAGLCITRTDGHGIFIGVAADDAGQVREATRGRLQAGADVIKIMSSGGVHTRTSDLMSVQYTVEELRAAVEEAHAAGKKVSTHSSLPQAMAYSAIAGVDSIEHGVFLDEPTAELMARHGTYYVPTLAATHLFEPNAGHPDVPDYVREKAKLTVPAHRQNFPIALRHDIKIAAGTDAGSSFVGHGRLVAEVQLLHRYGMAPLQAIAAATSVAAELLGIDERVGTLEPGKLADILLVAGDPVADLRALERVHMVFKEGTVVCC